MIISDNPLQLTCPYCSRVKHIRTIVSGNTFGGKCWSDGRWDYPMLRQPSPYQKCPKCRHYYLLAESNPTIVKLTSPDPIESAFDKTIGRLFAAPIEDLPDLPAVAPEVKAQEDKLRKEASRNGFGMLVLYELAEAGKDILPRCTTPEQREEFLLAYIHEYNDDRTGRIAFMPSVIMDEYRLLFEEYAKELTVVRGKPRTINAEMCRELGEFDRSVELCYQLLDAGTDIKAVRQILAYAEAHDPDVFELRSDEENPYQKLIAHLTDFKAASMK